MKNGKVLMQTFVSCLGCLAVSDASASHGGAGGWIYVLLSVISPVLMLGVYLLPLFFIWRLWSRLAAGEIVFRVVIAYLVPALVLLLVAIIDLVADFMGAQAIIFGDGGVLQFTTAGLWFFAAFFVGVEPNNFLLLYVINLILGLVYSFLGFWVYARSKAKLEHN